MVIENKIGSQPVYVRARAFGAPGYTLAYEGAGWSDGGDGWYYCEEALAGGAMTAALDVRILDVPPQPEEGEHFQVIVVYEATPVLYDAAGAPYADWDAIPENGGMGHD